MFLFRAATNECRKEKKKKKRTLRFGESARRTKKVLGLLLLTHGDLANSKEEKYERKDFFLKKNSGSSLYNGGGEFLADTRLFP